MSVKSILNNLEIKRLYDASYISERTHIKVFRVKAFLSGRQMPSVEELYKLARLPDCEGIVLDYLLELDQFLPEAIKEAFMNRGAITPVPREKALAQAMEVIDNYLYMGKQDDIALRQSAATILVSLKEPA